MWHYLSNVAHHLARSRCVRRACTCRWEWSWQTPFRVARWADERSRPIMLLSAVAYRATRIVRRSQRAQVGSVSLAPLAKSCCTCIMMHSRGHQQPASVLTPVTKPISRVYQKARHYVEGFSHHPGIGVVQRHAIRISLHSTTPSHGDLPYASGSSSAINGRRSIPPWSHSHDSSSSSTAVSSYSTS
jgi:hypothetical protein